MNKIAYSTLILCTSILMNFQTAVADVTAVYKMSSDNGSGTQTIQYKDGQHVRVEIKTDSMHHQATMMKLDNKIYAITGKVVQDMEQLSKMMALVGKNRKSKSKTSPTIKYKDTGKTEVIAGITGKLYTFQDHGKKHEIVLAQNKDLQTAVLGLVEIMKSSNGMMTDNSFNQLQHDKTLKSMALLRLDKVMQLESLNTNKIKKSVFILPSKPQQMGGLGNLLKKGLPN